MAAAKKANSTVRERIGFSLTRASPMRRFSLRPGELDFCSFDPQSKISHQTELMMQKTDRSIIKASAEDLKVGLICADRDGNRVRIDRVESNGPNSARVSYHYLNDELRVQEGVQERTIEQFLAEGWMIAAPGMSL
jgi:hypothetical protein